MHCLIWITLALAVAVADAAPAGGGTDDPPIDTVRQKMTSGPGRVTLIELFTSEGCSSCPPADRWLSGLARSPGLWRDFVPVAFHVDYWDELGWPDRFASAAYSARQRRYATEGGTRVVYTPGVFANGREWRAWRDTSPAVAPGSGGILALFVDGDRFTATYSPPADASTATLHVAVLGMDLATRVRAGENRGRRLQHDFVVLGLHSSPMRFDGGAWRAAGALPRPAAQAQRYAIASWVTAGDTQAPLQATGGFLAHSPRPAATTE